MSLLLNKDIKDYFKNESDVIEDSKKKNNKINRSKLFLFISSFFFFSFSILNLFEPGRSQLYKSFLLAFGTVMFFPQLLKDLMRLKFRRAFWGMILFCIGVSTVLIIGGMVK